MARVHFFQRYSSKENAVTNNTLLLLSQIYGTSPDLLENFISELNEDLNFRVGPEFGQQIKGVSSVPDGVVSQTNFKIVIETKLGDNVNQNQLKHHLDCFGKEDSQALLILTGRNVTEQIKKQVAEVVKEHNSSNSTSITEIWVTFQDLIKSIRSVLSDQHFQLSDLIDDFEEYCAESGLLPRANFRMRAVPCGKSFDENMKYGIYYEPPGRTATPYDYLGIYNWKAIRGIGKIANRIQAKVSGDSVEIINSQLNKDVNEEQKERILKTVIATAEKRGWDISNGHEFIILEKVVETNFKKRSKGGMRGTQYFDLGELLETDTLQSTSEIAKKLSNIEW